MAQSSPLRPVADVTPVTFYFAPTFGANIAVNFYDAIGVEVAGGTVDIAVSFPTGSYSGPVDGPTKLPDADWTAQNAVATLPSSEATPVDFGASLGVLKLTPSAVVSPVGATQYRIACSLVPSRTAV